MQHTKRRYPRNVNSHKCPVNQLLFTNIQVFLGATQCHQHPAVRACLQKSKMLECSRAQVLSICLSVCCVCCLSVCLCLRSENKPTTHKVEHAYHRYRSIGRLRISVSTTTKVTCADSIMAVARQWSFAHSVNKGCRLRKIKNQFVVWEFQNSKRRSLFYGFPPSCKIHFF